eukprot:GHVP01052572.1.p1 GENE.GHVP01052572.1~~GHVP01052572.1.p1  ORF type:complete len:119 (-),score=18.09 GHVP01052572.1:1563-1919(-)
MDKKPEAEIEEVLRKALTHPSDKWQNEEPLHMYVDAADTGYCALLTTITGKMIASAKKQNKLHLAIYELEWFAVSLARRARRRARRKQISRDVLSKSTYFNQREYKIVFIGKIKNMYL